MSFFSKAEWIEKSLPITYINDPEVEEACILTLEVSCNVLGAHKYCSVSYNVKPKIFDEIKELVKNCEGKIVTARFKIKKNKIKNFKIDLDSLAETFHDERLRKLEVGSYGIFDERFQNIVDRTEMPLF